jgi:DNA-binding NarL/FixJ family response regulator
MSSISNAIRILIADDHPATREGIRTMLERQEGMRVVAEAGDGEEAVARFNEHQPDLVLMDLQMPGMDGIQATAAIRALRPDARIVMVTSYAGDVRVSRALSAGASSYILKTANRSQVFAAISGALRGDVVLDETVAREVAANVGQEALSSREISVLHLVAQGKQNSEIGLALNVSEHTIKARLKSVLSKLNANDRAHAVSIARARGFMED